MTKAVHGDEHGTVRPPATAPALVGRSAPLPGGRLPVSVRMRPQSPEEEQRSAAAIRLFIAAITREHIERRTKEGEL